MTWNKGLMPHRTYMRLMAAAQGWFLLSVALAVSGAPVILSISTLVAGLVQFLLAQVAGFMVGVRDDNSE